MTEKLELLRISDLPLREVVFRTLRRAILNGTLVPGERLMEIPLSQQLGVSRTPVRDAIRMLEIEGLVIMLPHRGAMVAEISSKDLEDVLEVRAALEELAVLKACSNRTEEQMDALEKAAGDFADCLRRGDLMEGARADARFHEIISESTGNRRLMQILNNLREQVFRYRVENLKDSSAHENLVRQHEQLCRALRERAGEQAVQVIRRHIRHQRESILRTLQEKR